MGYYGDTDTFDTTPPDNSITMENIASNPYDIPMNIDDPGASIENLIAQNPSGTIGGPPNVFDINERGDPTTTMLDVPTEDVGLANPLYRLSPVVALSLPVV